MVNDAATETRASRRGAVSATWRGAGRLGAAADGLAASRGQQAARQPDLRGRARRFHREISRGLRLLARPRAGTSTAFDWRGQGRSRGDIGSRQCRELRPAGRRSAPPCWPTGARRRPGPHVAIGHSMGGHLLLRTIVERQPALDAAVLVAPMIAVEQRAAARPGWRPTSPTRCAGSASARQPMWKTPTAFKPAGVAAPTSS